MVNLPLFPNTTFVRRWLKSLIFAFIVALPQYKIVAQPASVDLKITPPTPEVSSLGKFGDIPVGLHTGVAQVSVPIFTMKVKDIEVPISLDYHASGVRVEEIASSVGIGFALNAGGAIFSTVNGYPDLGPGGFLNTPHPDFVHFFPNGEDGAPPANNPDYTYAKSVAWGDIDSEPDIFHFNFLGRAGKFTFDAQKNIHPIPFQKIKITHAPFRIQDEQGTMYYFGHDENMSLTSQGCNDSGLNIINTTYKLSRIESVQGAVVDITYKTVQYSYPLTRTETDYRRNPPLQTGCSGFPPAPVNCEKTAHVTGRFIESIVSNDSTIVEFKYSDEERKDLPGTYALKKIIIRRAGSETPVKEFLLSYDYHVSNGAPSTYTPAAAPYYRLLLKSVVEVGKSAYKFSYNETIKMPQRHSPDQDAWGYFNNAGNSSLLPEYISKELGKVAGANRNVNPAYAQSLMLQRIVYPTGGITEFTYESNYYNKDNTETEAVVEPGAAGVANTTGNPADQSYTFDLPFGATQVNVDFNNYGCPGSEQPGFYCRLRLHNNTNPGTDLFFNQSILYPLPLESGNYTLTLESEDCDCSGGLHWQAYKLIPVDPEKKYYVGGMRISKIVNYPGDQGSTPVVRRYNYDVPNTTNASSGYILYEPKFVYDIYTAEFINANEYFYCTFLARTASSILPLGAIQGSSIGYRYVTELFGETGEFGKTTSEFNLVKDIKLDTKVPHAPSTSYDWLRGLLINKTDFAYDAANVSQPYKEVRKIHNEYEIRHNYLSFYDFIYHHDYNETNTLGVKILLLSPEVLSGTSNPYAIFHVSTYKNVSAFYFLKETQETTWDVTDAGKTIETVTRFFYDNPAHAQLSRKESEVGNRTVIDEFTYPLDYVNVNTGVLAEMKGSRHMHGVPIEVLTKERKNGVTQVIGGSFTTYDFIGQDNPVTATADERMILPVRVEGAELNTPKEMFTSSVSTGTAADDSYADKLFMTYNQVNGRLAEARKEDDASTAYLWGYDNSLLIAETKNALSIQVFHTSFEETGDLFDDSKTGRRCLEGDYIFSPPAGFAPVANSILSYWYWMPEDNKWHYKQVSYSGGSVTLADGSKIDEVRIYPANAFMTTYTYDPLIGTTSVTDANSVTTYYHYDEAGRLSLIRDNQRNVLKQYRYHYKEN